MPVAATRDPPPLYSWEVFPHLYPPAPVPRAPGQGYRRLVLAGLAAAAILLAGVSAMLVADGVGALGPDRFGVSGEVEAPPLGVGGTASPLAGAVVNLSGEGGFVARTVTGPSGDFAFSGIPSGGVSLNFTSPGYENLSVTMFVSGPYRSPGADHGLLVTLTPGRAANGTTIIDTPFANLEGFLTEVGSSTVLLLGGCAIATLGAVYAARERFPAVVTAGGAGAAAAGVSVYLLGVAAAFPVVGLVASVAIALGAMAAGLQGLWMAWTGDAPEAEPPTP